MAAHRLYGHHAVLAALENPLRRPKRLWITAENKALVPKQPPCSVEVVDKQALHKLAPAGAVHQGWVLDCALLEQPALEDIVAEEPQTIILLDQVTDPQNIGGIIRSAAALGAAAVVVQDRHAPGETPALVKTACGGFERVPYIGVTNLSRSLTDLQAAGYWCIGFSEHADVSFAPKLFSQKTVLVFGAEGEGMRRLVTERCDQLARLPTNPDFPSLNVTSTVTAVLLSRVLAD